MATIRSLTSSLSATGSAVLGTVDSLCKSADLLDGYLQRKLSEQAIATEDHLKVFRAEHESESLQRVADAAKRVIDYSAKSESHAYCIQTAAKVLAGESTGLAQLIAAKSKSK